MILQDVEFNIRGKLTQQEDILRCLRSLIMTPAGTVPLDREFGIDHSILSQPIDVAESLIAVEIVEKVARYEPRVSAQAVSLSADVNGQITAKVVIASG